MKRASKKLPPQRPTGIAKYTAALCILALVAAAFGLHLEYAANAESRFFLLDHSTSLSDIYQLVQEHGFPIPYREQKYNQVFPDTLTLIGLSQLFQNPYAAIHAFVVLCVLTSAAGLFLVMRLVAGQYAYLALPVAALPSLLIAYGIHEELFVTAYTVHFRNGMLALLPLLLYLSLRVLFDSSPKWTPRILLFVLMFFLLSSFVIPIIWFVIPALGMALIVAWKKWLPPPSATSNLFWFIGILAVAWLLAQAVGQSLAELVFIFADSNKQATQLSLSLDALNRSTVLSGAWLSDVITRRPSMFLLWVTFTMILCHAVWLALRTKRKKKDNAIFYAVALFLLASVVLPPLTSVLSGKYVIWGRVEHFANHRYFASAVYWPLFWGWPLLAGFYLPYLRKRFSKITKFPFVPVFAAAVLLLSLPLFRHLPKVGALGEYSSPFLVCLTDNAPKHHLKDGVSTEGFARYISAHTNGELKLLPVLNNLALATLRKKKLKDGASPFLQHPHFSARKMSGKDFNYIIVNNTDAAKQQTPPELKRCPGRLDNPRLCLDSPDSGYPTHWIGYHFIDSKTVTDFYGTPDSTFRCENVDFYVYKNGLRDGNLLMKSAL